MKERQAGIFAWRLVLVYILCGTVVGAGTFWACAELFGPGKTDPVVPQYLYARAIQSFVEDQVPVNVSASWAVSAQAPNQAKGIVTGILPGAAGRVEVGAILYTVNLRPVVAAVGEVPSFRSLSEGIKGPDVCQLQSMLATLDFFDGKSDGNFGPQTTAAVKKWQAFQGVDVDGVVAVGDIVYFQTLPVGVELDPEQIQVGRALAGGEPGIKVTVSPPTFVISLTADQAKEIDVGTPVSVPQSTATWQGTVSQLVVQSDQSVNAVLEGVGGAPFCGQECDTVPAARQPSLPGIATLTPRTAGIVVPTAAVQTRSNGLTVVVDRQGTKRAVTVAVSAGGKSVIRGVPEGTEVRVGGR